VRERLQARNVTEPFVELCGQALAEVEQAFHRRVDHYARERAGGPLEKRTDDEVRVGLAALRWEVLGSPWRDHEAEEY